MWERTSRILAIWGKTLSNVYTRLSRFHRSKLEDHRDHLDSPGMINRMSTGEARIPL